MTPAPPRLRLDSAVGLFVRNRGRTRAPARSKHASGRQPCATKCCSPCELLAFCGSDTCDDVFPSHVTVQRDLRPPARLHPPPPAAWPDDLPAGFDYDAGDKAITIPCVSVENFKTRKIERALELGPIVVTLDTECGLHCPASWLGDAYCDLQCNTEACLLDHDDCDGSTDSVDFEAECSPGCTMLWVGDGFCDAVCQTEASHCHVMKPLCHVMPRH